MEFTGNSATGSYTANGTEVFNLGADNYPQNGGVALDGQGDLFFGDDDNSAVVYEAPVTTSVSPTSSSTSSSTSTTSPAPRRPAPRPTSTTSTSTTSTSTTSTTAGTTDLVPDPNFAASAVPGDYWGSTLAREA